MKDFLYHCWPFFAAAILLLIGAFLLDAHDCRVYSKVTANETNYEFGTCYVKQSGGWYTREEMKIRNATKGE